MSSGMGPARQGEGCLYSKPHLDVVFALQELAEYDGACSHQDDHGQPHSEESIALPPGHYRTILQSTHHQLKRR